MIFIYLFSSLVFSSFPKRNIRYSFVYFSILYIFFKCLFLRERQSVSRGGAEREGDTDSEAGSRLWAVSTEPNMGARTHKLWDRDLSRIRRSTNWATPVPLFYFLEKERERDRVWAGEGQRERETQNPKQAPGSELSAQSPTQGSNSQTVRSWPEPKPPRCPFNTFFFKRIKTSDNARAYKNILAFRVIQHLEIPVSLEKIGKLQFSCF